MADTNDHDATYSYRLLSRLQQDCEYYLGAGNRSKKHLWALDEAAQIAKMKELYAGLPDKPEWITQADIERYEKAMNSPSPTEKVSAIGTKDGKPAIEYWRHGEAAKGEPSVVTRVQTFEDVAARDAALLGDSEKATKPKGSSLGM